MTSTALGIDLGGTKVRAAVVTESGEILADHREATEADTPADNVFSNIVRAAHEACTEAGLEVNDLAGVGIGSPAPIDIERGMIVSPPNLPSLHGFPIVAKLQEALGKPTVLNNDGNCFGLAEGLYGAGKDTRVCCGLTLGTGLGCAVVVDEVLYNGPRGAAAEIWCSPHGDETIEESVSGRGISRNFERYTGQQADPPEIAELARGGSEHALAAWADFGRDLATPVAYLANILDPDVVILGGSISQAFDLFEDALREHALPHINRICRDNIRIVTAELGNQAGVLGAAALVFTEL